MFTQIKTKKGHPETELFVLRQSTSEIEFIQIDLDGLKATTVGRIPVLESGGKLRRFVEKLDVEAGEPIKLNTRVSIDIAEEPIHLHVTPNGEVKHHSSFSMISQTMKVNSTHILNKYRTSSVLFWKKTTTYFAELDRENLLMENYPYIWRVLLFNYEGDPDEYSLSRQRLFRTRNRMIVVPNLETVIYMHDLIYRPFDLLNHTGEDKIPLPKLLKDTWCGETMEEDLGRRIDFNFEDDLPALAFMMGEAGEFDGCLPKQNSKGWLNHKENLSSPMLMEVYTLISTKNNWPERGISLK